MVSGMVGFAVEAATTTAEVGATKEGGWTEDGLVGVVLAVAAGAAAAWEVAGSVGSGLDMVRVLI
jgi:hypothetical protein